MLKKMSKHVEKVLLKNMATEEVKNTSTIHKEFQSLLDQDFKNRKLRENEIIQASVTEITKNYISRL